MTASENSRNLAASATASIKPIEANVAEFTDEADVAKITAKLGENSQKQPQSNTQGTEHPFQNRMMKYVKNDPAKLEAKKDVENNAIPEATSRQLQFTETGLISGSITGPIEAAEVSGTLKDIKVDIDNVLMILGNWNQNVAWQMASTTRFDVATAAINFTQLEREAGEIKMHLVMLKKRFAQTTSTAVVSSWSEGGNQKIIADVGYQLNEFARFFESSALFKDAAGRANDFVQKKLLPQIVALNSPSPKVAEEIAEIKDIVARVAANAVMIDENQATNKDYIVGAASDFYELLANFVAKA